MPAGLCRLLFAVVESVVSFKCYYKDRVKIVQGTRKGVKDHCQGGMTYFVTTYKGRTVTLRPIDGF
jgi:hypothetical protein